MIRALGRAVIAGIGLLASVGTVLSQPLPISDATQAAATTLGPGAQDSVDCQTPYGDTPRPLTPLSPDWRFGYQNSCWILGGEKLWWQDRYKLWRNACLITPPNASPQKPLPLVVWLHPSGIPIDSVLGTNILPMRKKADLTGDPERPGFVLLLPEGRDTEHFYGFPLLTGYGWDNWYRNLDRNSDFLNLDAAAIDQFIEVAKSRGNIDTQRIYMSGWSNGASFALLYALNTPGIAAAAVYSAPAPFSDFDDPCWQTPFATQATPVYDLHSSCDIDGICQTGTQFFAQLGTIYPQIPQKSVIVNRKNGKVVNACDASCGPGSANGYSTGTNNHFVWPFRYTQDMFTFLREHPLVQ